MCMALLTAVYRGCFSLPQQEVLQALVLTRKRHAFEPRCIKHKPACFITVSISN
jgi:hypothetical protein